MFRRPLLLDPRSGSGSLLGPLRGRGIPVESRRLEFGDIAFIGNGPEGRPVPVGIEYKKLPDMLQSYRDKRFAGHQLPGMCRTYERVWLLVEGDCRPDPATGLLQVQYHGLWVPYRGRVMWRDYRAAILTFELRAGIRTWHTSSQSETVFAIGALYGWWTGKEWEEHRSHLAFDESGPEGLLVRHSLKRRWAKELAGIGYDKSKAVAQYFGSALDMASAHPADWAKIDGVGGTLAARITEEIRKRG